MLTTTSCASCPVGPSCSTPRSGGRTVGSGLRTPPFQRCRTRKSRPWWPPSTTQLRWRRCDRLFKASRMARAAFSVACAATGTRTGPPAAAAAGRCHAHLPPACTLSLVPSLDLSPAVWPAHRRREVHDGGGGAGGGAARQEGTRCDERCAPQASGAAPPTRPPTRLPALPFLPPLMRPPFACPVAAGGCTLKKTATAVVVGIYGEGVPHGESVG